MKTRIDLFTELS